MAGHKAPSLTTQHQDSTTEGPHAGARTLALAVSQGDEEAQRQFLTRLQPRVRTTVRYMVNDDAEAEDFSQLALIHLLRAAHTYNATGSLEAWADRVAMRVTLRELAKRSRRLRLLRQHGMVLVPPTHSKEYEERRRELCRRIATLLSALKPERRAALVLRLVFKYSVAEVATMLGIPSNTAKDRIQKARAELRSAAQADPVCCAWLGRDTP